MTITWRREPAKVQKGSHLSLFVVVVLALATFGPYVTGSVRTEQIAAYALLIVLAPVIMAKLRVNASAALLVPWTAYLIVATFGVIFPSQLNARWEAGSVLAGYDNILLPLAVMTLIWSVVPIDQAPKLLATVSRIAAVAMAVNGVLAIISIRVDLRDYLRPFWSNAAAEGLTVAELAAQLGRYSGIFNQPAEAGALYGIAGLAAVYVWKDRPLRLALVVGLITVGGLLSVSKVFILGGLPLILFYWMWAQRKGKKIGLIVGLVLLAVGVVQSGLFGEWSGANFLARLINPAGGVLGFYTAGRFESGSNVFQVIAEVLAISPMTGIGAGGWLVPYDGALAESLVTAGILGLILYGVTLIAVFIVASKIAEPHLRRFAYLFAIVLVGAAAGFSPLTGSRVATITWLFIALLVLCKDQSRNLQTRTLARGGRHPL